MDRLKLFDTVAIIPTYHLVTSQVGTIVEILRDDYYEVEFANKKGETIVSTSISSAELMMLHYELEYA